MAVDTDFQQLRSELTVTTKNSGDATTAKDIEWVDMQDYDSILVVAHIGTLGTSGGISTFKILANPESNGSGTDVEIKAHALSNAPDAAGEYVVLEATAEEIGGAGANLRYVSANLQTAAAGDNVVVTYVRRATHAQKDNTSDNVS